MFEDGNHQVSVYGQSRSCKMGIFVDVPCLPQNGKCMLHYKIGYLALRYQFLRKR